MVRSRRAPGSTTDPSVDLRVDELSLHVLDDLVEHQAVGLEHVLEPPGVLPPATHDVRLDPAAGVDEVLDRIGDLKLAAQRGLDRAGGVVNAG